MVPQLTLGEVRATLSDIWTTALDARPNDDDDFFELGGDSMELVMLLLAVGDRFDINLSIDELFTDTFTFGASVNAVAEALRIDGASGGRASGGETR